MWLGSLTFNYLPLTTVGSNLTRDFGIFHVSKLCIGTSVVLIKHPNMPEITHGKSPIGIHPPLIVAFSIYPLSIISS